jgi:hypothetical protein
MFLVALALVVPLLVLAAAVVSRRTIGIPIAIVGAVAGCWIFFTADHPVPHERNQEGYPLSYYEAMGYRIERTYGAALMVLFGVTLLTRGSKAFLDGRKPWPEPSDKIHPVTDGSDLPRVSVDSKKGKPV